MVRKCYGFEWANSDFIFACSRAEKAYPCFVIFKDVNEDFGEVEVVANAEDIAGIENILAPYYI